MDKFRVFSALKTTTEKLALQIHRQHKPQVRVKHTAPESWRLNELEENIMTNKVQLVSQVTTIRGSTEAENWWATDSGSKPGNKITFSFLRSVNMDTAQSMQWSAGLCQNKQKNSEIKAATNRALIPWTSVFPAQLVTGQACHVGTISKVTLLFRLNGEFFPVSHHHITNCFTFFRPGHSHLSCSNPSPTHLSTSPPPFPRFYL